MNKKIFDNFVAWIGILGGVELSLTLIDELFISKECWMILPGIWLDYEKILISPEILKWIRVGIAISFVVLMIILLQVKKRFVNLYSLLEIMSLNNKLHTLRVMVLIIQNRIKQRTNKLRIDRAEFRYHLFIPNFCKPSRWWRKPEFYNVRYSLLFQLSKPRRRRLTECSRRFQFYMICENGKPRNMSTCILIDGIPQDVTPVIHSVTIYGSGQDRIEDFSGLYQVTLILPRSITYRSVIEIKITYEMEKHIRIQSGQYNFAILPANYGKKIQEMHISITTDEIEIFHPEIQRMDSDGNVDITALFTSTEENGLSIYGKKVQPKMDAMYSIQFDWPTSSRNF